MNVSRSVVVTDVASLATTFAVVLSWDDVAAIQRATGEADALADVEMMIRASLASLIHRGMTGLRADVLEARGDIEIGRASHLALVPRASHR